MIGLTEVYGIEFGEFVPLDFGPRITALEEGSIDVALLFTTDASIEAKGFVVLEDDKGLQPAENVAPAVNQEIVDAYGSDFTDLINSISAKITTEGLTKLNFLEQVEVQDPEVIAHDWLVENGFIEG